MEHNRDYKAELLHTLKNLEDDFRKIDPLHIQADTYLLWQKELRGQMGQKITPDFQHWLKIHAHLLKDEDPRLADYIHYLCDLV